MDVILDILIIQLEVEYAIIHTQFCIIHVLRFQINVALLVMVLIVVAHTVIQLTKRRTVDPATEIKTELNGLNCQFNDLVGLMLDENLSNITGRITGLNGQTVTTDIELPEDVWEGIVYISRKDGSYGEYTFYRNDSHTLYLDSYPDIDWDSEFGKSLEYPLFAIGELQLCWVTAVKPESGNRCSLKLINYSEDIFKDDIKENNQ